MASIPFPAIRPSGRTYSPGSFPQGKFTALNGATTILRYSNRRADSSLELEFSNISDTQAAQLLELYVSTERGGHWILFTRQNALAGLSAALEPWMSEITEGLRWRFAGPPRVTSVMPGRSQVSAEFTGYLDA